MLSILGMGSARPETVLSNDFLVELGLAPSSDAVYKSTGIRERRTTLSLQYIRDAKNSVPKNALENASETPTDLSVRAAEQALLRAGISADKIGLLIGDSATPHQTTPSEAQRLGQRLGLKIPAYDAGASSGAFTVFLETLLNWKPERMPEYVLFVTSNTPTQSIDYSKGREGWHFGDEAGVVIASYVHEGKLRVKSAENEMKIPGSNSFYVHTYKHLHLDEEKVFPQIIESISRTLENLKGGSNSMTSIVPPRLSYPACVEALARGGFFAQNIMSSVELSGDTLGSGPIADIAERWDTITKGDKIVTASAGLGLSYGTVTLEAV